MDEKKVTYLCVVRLLLDSTTVLEGLFREYHSSSAAPGKQRLGVTVTVVHTPATDLSSAFERSDVLNISDVRVLLLPPPITERWLLGNTQTLLTQCC